MNPSQINFPRDCFFEEFIINGKTIHFTENIFTNVLVFIFQPRIFNFVK